MFREEPRFTERDSRGSLHIMETPDTWLSLPHSVDFGKCYYDISRQAPSEEVHLPTVLKFYELQTFVAWWMATI
jgi:hypothetical protein